MVDTRGIICVFAKAALPGFAKTRLAPAVGLDGAAQLARAFLQDTYTLARRQPLARTVLTTPGGVDALSRQFGVTEIWSHSGADLGARVEQVLRCALLSAPWAIALGADSPGLPGANLRQACELLQHGSDAVIGPCDDGGFYLLGLRCCPRDLLAKLPWSQPDTCQATRRRLLQQGWSVQSLQQWFDVDRPQDLSRLVELVRSDPRRAPATLAALNALGLRGDS